jgi:hypothetical protein
MKRLTAIGLASLAAYGILLVAKWDGSGASTEGKPGESAVVATGNLAVGSGLPASGDGLVQAMPVRQLSTMRMPVSRSTAPGAHSSTVAAEFRSSRDLKAFADALAARKGQLTADERFHLAKALESCLFANSINEDLASYSAKQRRQFLASLPAGDPNAALRVAAFDNVDDTARCLRFRGTKIALRDIDDLYLAAAQQGDARAQAKLLANEIQRTNQANPRDEAGNPSRIAPEDLARIVAILETGDPEAVMTVGGLLAQSPIKEQLRVGPNEEMPEPTAFIGAWNLVACDMGLDCGAQHRDLQQACAFAAYCGAGHFEEHYQTFVASPFVYQQAQRYRALIHSALATRNWAQLGLTQKLTSVAAAKPSK